MPGLVHNACVEIEKERRVNIGVLMRTSVQPSAATIGDAPVDVPRRDTPEGGHTEILVATHGAGTLSGFGRGYRCKVKNDNQCFTTNTSRQERNQALE